MPPGWPLVLAGAMRVCSSFWFLNLVQMCLMLGAFVLFYRVMLRLTSVRRASVVCLTVGMISPIYHRTFLLHSEPLFFLTGAAAVMVALQLNEGRSAAWRVPLMLGLVAAGVMVRWAGILLCPVVIGALLRGHVRPAWNKLWVCAVLTGLLGVGMLFGIRYSLNLLAQVAPPQAEAATYAANEHPIMRDLLSAPGRLPQAGVWFCNLLAEPAAVGASFGAIRAAAFVTGWVLLAFFLAGLVPAIRKRDWVVPGAFVYALGFISMWQNPSPRYLGPVAPFLFLGILNGVDLLEKVGSAAVWPRLKRVFVVGLFVCIGVSNLTLYAVDVWMIHSHDFYGNYLAGQTKPLIAIADYLDQHGVKDGEVVRSFMTRGKQGVSPTTGRLLDMRGLSLLIDRVILTMPRSMGGPPDEEIAKWVSDHHARYYIERLPINPWRVWHFRVPWLQKLMTGQPVGETTPYYILHELKGGQFREVPIPAWDGRIERVPHL